MSPLLRALFEGQISSVVALCYENERPLAGIAGELDWCFHGFLSHAIRKGVLTGALGEYLYFPLSQGVKTYSVLLLGQGPVEVHGQRRPPAEDTYPRLQKQLSHLGWSPIGLSLEDFGSPCPQTTFKTFKKGSLWIAP